ncbi:MAG: lytic transglycosylase, partial [Pseudomonadota bacterium]|nr:lytic transglycosylase [Pseudomonadota bacterium]
ALSDARNQYLAYHEGHTGYARGSYRSKSWLVRVADQVAARADTYRSQLTRCR